MMTFKHNLVILSLFSMLLLSASHVCAQSKTFTVDSLDNFKIYKLGSDKSLYKDSLYETREPNLFRVNINRSKTVFGDTLRSCLVRFDKNDKLSEIIFVYDVLSTKGDAAVLKEKVDNTYRRICAKLNSQPIDLKEGKHFEWAWIGKNNTLRFIIDSGVAYELILIPGEYGTHNDIIVRKLVLKLN